MNEPGEANQIRPQFIKLPRIPLFDSKEADGKTNYVSASPGFLPAVVYSKEKEIRKPKY